MMLPTARARTLAGLASFLIVAASVVIWLSGSPFVSGAFDVKQICHDAISHELRAHHGLSTTGDYSIAHQSVVNRSGNSKEVHGDGKYQSAGGTKTFKYDCVVSLTDGQVKYLAVHP